MTLHRERDRAARSDKEKERKECAPARSLSLGEALSRINGNRVRTSEREARHAPRKIETREREKEGAKRGEWRVQQQRLYTAARACSLSSRTKLLLRTTEATLSLSPCCCKKRRSPGERDFEGCATLVLHCRLCSRGHVFSRGLDSLRGPFLGNMYGGKGIAVATRKLGKQVGW